jgi:hypothetical protein
MEQKAGVGSMTEYIKFVSLAVTAMFALLFFVSAIAGIVRGRVKIEPNQPWVVLREHPVRFAGYVLWYLFFAFSSAVAAAKIASSLL